MKITIPSHLSDDALIDEAKSLAGRGRETTARLVAHLAELDERRLHLRAGFPSLFMYCREVLRLSENEAYNRIEAARAARRFPILLDRLADGSLNLTTVRLLAAHLTQENHEELLASATGKSRRELEEFVARLHPKPDVVASIRKLPGPRVMPALTLGAGPAPSLGPEPAVTLGPEPAEAAPAPVPRRPPAGRPVMSPLAPDRYQIRFTASAATCDKLRQAQDLLRHAIPSGDPAQIIDRALTLLLKELARQQFAATERPRRSRGPAPGSRTVAARVRRVVSEHDEGRCAYVSADGRRCNTRAYVQFHHVDPYAVGGEATIEKTELRCRAHNNYEADLFYGRRWPERRAGRKSRRGRVAAGE